MKKPRKAKRVAPAGVHVQITEGPLSISFDITKLDDGALAEIAEITKREITQREAQRRQADAYRCPRHKELP